MCCCRYSDSEWTGRPAGCGVSPDAALLKMHVCCCCCWKRVDAKGVGASALPAANHTPRYPPTDCPHNSGRAQTQGTGSNKPVDGYVHCCCPQNAPQNWITLTQGDLHLLSLFAAHIEAIVPAAPTAFLWGRQANPARCVLPFGIWVWQPGPALMLPWQQH